MVEMMMYSDRLIVVVMLMMIWCIGRVFSWGVVWFIVVKMVLLFCVFICCFLRWWILLLCDLCCLCVVCGIVG